MKKSKFSEAQIVKILGEVSSGKPTKEVCSAHGVSEATFYVWKRKYAGMEQDDVRRLRELEKENEALKLLLAERDLEVRTRFRSSDVQRTLRACFEERGAPERLRSDNGSEFIARTLAAFLSQAGTGSHFIKPGSPWQNGFIESFNSRLRAECLDVEASHNLADAQMKLAVYRRWYNEERPHSSIGNVAPALFRRRCPDSGRATPSLRPNIATTETTEKL